jgi:DNA-binding HxlR family transcriptional regulator
MLTATVRSLERDGLLTRDVYAEVPPRVEYELTPLGRQFMQPVLALVTWVQMNQLAIRANAIDSIGARTIARLVTPVGIRFSATGRGTREHPETP